VTYVITPKCVDVQDRSCIRECPVDCIYEGDRTLYNNPRSELMQLARRAGG
jgi:NAD-dependent dihydropyrimidine dehydrogenase PreA subunit